MRLAVREDFMAPTPPASPSDTSQPHGTRRRQTGLARDLGLAIVSGRYRPGDLLPNEIDLSRRLDVSRSALREAIHTLSAKGLVDARPRAGTRVLEPRHWTLTDPDVLDWCLEAGDASSDLLQALQSLRLIIEPAAAALAAEHRTPADLTALREALMASERAGDDDALRLTAIGRFRSTLLAATRNPALESLKALCGLSDRSRPLPDYWPVFDAIAAGGPDAAREAMGQLIRETLHPSSR